MRALDWHEGGMIWLCDMLTVSVIALTTSSLTQDRPERAIYNPAQRAAQRRKEMEARSRSKDSPESSQSPEGRDERE